jgi:hypothetical protein
MTTPATEVAEPSAEARSTALSEQWLDLARTGQETLAGTIVEFVETVERVIPVSAGVAKQRQIIESGLAMAHAVARVPYSAGGGLVKSLALVNVDVETVNVGVDTSVDVDVASREPAGAGVSK